MSLFVGRGESAGSEMVLLLLTPQWPSNQPGRPSLEAAIDAALVCVAVWLSWCVVCVCVCSPCGCGVYVRTSLTLSLSLSWRNTLTHNKTTAQHSSAFLHPLPVDPDFGSPSGFSYPFSLILPQPNGGCRSFCHHWLWWFSGNDVMVLTLSLLFMEHDSVCLTKETGSVCLLRLFSSCLGLFFVGFL